MKHREYIIRESFPVGEMGVCLIESSQSPKEYLTYLYRSEDMYTSMKDRTFDTREDAYNDYFRRCDRLIEKHEKKTGKPFSLPSYCTSVLRSTGDLIFLRRGMTGYYPSPFAKKGDRAGNEALSEQINAQFGYTKAQVAAMEAGSMFGWNVPGADPSRYDDEGRFISDHGGCDEVGEHSTDNMER